MANPFDDVNGRFHVLANSEEQHSLWPVFIDVPDGWEVRLRDAYHDEALTYVDEHWTDMRPASLIAAMESDERSTPAC